ncbi:hypothetical protein CF319_g3718 [Tilletia indica]|uniref:Survival protein SurE-like phosphatase/nucleotidase domain-containing protein n=1 Tax=Tilletia walkeri TaxID=117179 RepID=A0A8X7N572_9BASI|nr:hypothetical protein CF327_g6032 [Tilletia walkeri]KAE8223213.1 hypothetical protein CF319_g3718 [Tilletia indica]KAE8233458.1 hypothetical protein CF326_g1509 [Tilletia indica]KAE8265704.1 hypothetical protein A4X09_0g6554 [Tilletia walkeri]
MRFGTAFAATLSLNALLAAAAPAATVTSSSATGASTPSATATSTATYGAGAPAFAKVVKAKNPLNILLTNDDSAFSANIRATFYALQTAGHRVLMVAPFQNQSGKGGTVVLPQNLTTTAPNRDGTVAAGGPYADRNQTDSSIRWFDGSPAAALLWGLDQEAPGFFNANDTNGGVNLVVSGPNEGNNLGPFIFTLSGTVGATYTAVERGVPAIAFSASTRPRSYTTLDFNNTQDESIQLGTATANFVTRFVDAASNFPYGKSSAKLPEAVGLNVNYSPLNTNCTAADFKWKQTRLTGGAIVDKLVVGSNGLPTYQDLVTSAVNKCNSGDCFLPGETNVVAVGTCAASVSVYSTDYDAPLLTTAPVTPALGKALFQLNNA